MEHYEQKFQTRPVLGVRKAQPSKRTRIDWHPHHRLKGSRDEGGATVDNTWFGCCGGGDLYEILPARRTEKCDELDPPTFDG